MGMIRFARDLRLKFAKASLRTMTPPKVEQVCELLHGLPIEEQLFTLLAVIVQANPDGFDVAARMLGATGSCLRIFPTPTGSRSARSCAMQPT